MTTSFQTVCLLYSPPLNPILIPSSSTSKTKKPSSLRKSQKTWIIHANSHRSKLVCMSHQPIHQQFLEGNFKKDEDIVRLAPLILKEPILVNFDTVLSYQVFNSSQTKSVYELALKFQVEELFSGKSSNVILLGPSPLKILEQLVAILSKHILDILKIQQNTTHKLGISIQSVISNSISIDLLEQETVTSFKTMNQKAVSIVRLKHPEEINSVLYLSNKNKEKFTKVLESQSKKQLSMVYKLMLKSGQSTFSEIALYSPSNIKTINQREIEGILQYIQSITKNDKQYLLHIDNQVLKNLVNQKTISPSSITLIYGLINDKKHIQQNLITLNLAEAINEKTGKKEYVESYSFLTGGNVTKRNQSKTEREYQKSWSREKSPDYNHVANRKLRFELNTQQKKLFITDRNNSSNNITKKDIMNQQLERKVAHLQKKIKEMATQHREQLERLRTQAVNKQDQYNQQIVAYDNQIRQLSERLKQGSNNHYRSFNTSRSKPRQKEDNEQNIHLKQQIISLRQNNQTLTEKCKQLEIMLEGKNRVEEKLESVKKERNDLKQTMKKMNQEIYQLIRDQEMDINKLRKQ